MPLEALHRRNFAETESGQHATHAPGVDVAPVRLGFECLQGGWALRLKILPSFMV